MTSTSLKWSEQDYAEQHIDFGVTQVTKSNGARKVGSLIASSTQTFVSVQPTSGRSYYTIEPGTYFVWEAHATRDGQRFGACQPTHYCKTEATRALQVANYLKSAKARALKKFA
jgi:hypothetical protein